MKFGAIAVYCASSDGLAPHWRLTMNELGRLLAQRGITVVYGGGKVGLMGALADGALEAGGRVVGVIPRGMVEAERAHTGVSELHVVETMHQRKALMVERSDGFIAAPGGYGTLDELFETVTWAQLGIHAKPVGILNAADPATGRGFYDGLLSFLDGAVGAGFIQPRFRGLLCAADSASLLLEQMRAAEAPAGAGWARRPG